MNVHFLSTHDNWSTPKDVYVSLDREFKFDYDPCPLYGSGGLEASWGNVNFVNPPYSKIKGRLKFGGVKNSAPFPSCIVVFKGGE